MKKYIYTLLLIICAMAAHAQFSTTIVDNSWNSSPGGSGGCPQANTRVCGSLNFAYIYPSGNTRFIDLSSLTPNSTAITSVAYTIQGRGMSASGTTNINLSIKDYYSGTTMSSWNNGYGIAYCGTDGCNTLSGSYTFPNGGRKLVQSCGWGCSTGFYYTLEEINGGAWWYTNKVNLTFYYKTISIGNLNATSFCSSSPFTLSVPYSVSHNLTAGNKFISVISRTNGTVVRRDTITSVSSGTFNINLPAGFPVGNYRVKVQSTLPDIETPTKNFTVYNPTQTQGYVNGQTTRCTGKGYSKYSFSANVTGLTVSGWSINPPSAGTISLSNGYCFVNWDSAFTGIATITPTIVIPSPCNTTVQNTSLYVNCSPSLSLSTSNYTYHSTFNGKHYYKSINNSYWESAKTNAEAGCATLVSINSSQEQSHVQTIVSSFPSNEYVLWSGGTDEPQEGNLVWLDGTSMSAFTNWSPGEPVNNISHNAVAIYGPTQTNANKWLMASPNSYYSKSILEKTANQTLAFTYTDTARLCTGQQITIPYTTTGVYDNGNIFLLQLSNAAGSFAAPVTIGTINSVASGNITGTIPANTIDGIGYRIRVVSSSPGIVSADNGYNLRIGPLATYYLDADNDNYYTGSPITQCGSPGAGYKTTGLIAGNDCNDADANSNPGKVEVCGNAVDENCDGIAYACGVIATGSITTPLCVLNINVPFTVSNPYAANNVFTAQLSNASGSFASPVNIGTLSGTGSGTISATIPANTPAGSGYRIRVVSSNPINTGTDNGSNLVVPSKLYTSNLTKIHYGDGTWCAGETRKVGIVVTNTGTATWTNSGPDINIGVKWNTDADYFVRVDANNLAPGSTGYYQLNITAPSTPGTYTLQADVVKEGDCWFGSGTGSCNPCNSVITSSTINVVNSSSTAPTSISGTPVICSGNSVTLTSQGGSLGQGAVDVWYTESCTEAYDQNWNIDVWDFSNYHTAGNYINNGIFNLTSTGNDAQFNMLNLGSFNPNTYKYINIRYRVISGTAGNVEIYFTNSSYTTANAAQVVSAPLISNGQWQTVAVPMFTHPSWTSSNITGWRYDWCTASGVTMDLDFISLGAGPVIGSGNSITVSPTATTTYYTKKKGSCNNTACASYTVMVDNCSTVAPVTGASSVCVGQTTTLSTPYPAGGSVLVSGGWRRHSFTTVGSSSFNVPAGMAKLYVEALVVGGGGGGGSNRGGGGGGGVYNYASQFELTNSTYTVVVGAGGAGAATTGVRGSNGGSSSFASITSAGGGGGGSHKNPPVATCNGNSGGSGGGGAMNFGTNIFSGGSASQGNVGGGSGQQGSDSPRNTGGGGGAGGVGITGAGTTTPPNGGAGVASGISGTLTYYCGGGGGADGRAGTETGYSSAGRGLGGIGGGGNGAMQGGGGGSAGAPNTGGGGGGGNAGLPTMHQNGFNGGSGIVILAYRDGTWSSSNTAVATVNPTTGVVSGVAPGTATITYSITYPNGSTSTASKTITVTGNQWYLDADADGYYTSTQTACTSPGAGWTQTVTASGDCAPNDPTKWRLLSGYVDADGDGYTVGSLLNNVCSGASLPAGYVATSLGTDCNDANATRWQLLPGYTDTDGDGYTVGSLQSVCSGAILPSGYVPTSLGTDCNDNNPAVHASYPFYVDIDGDGVGTGALANVCAVNDTTPPTGYSLTNTDCAPSDNTKWQILTGYADADGDTYTVGSLQNLCSGASLPTGYSAYSNGADCNDNNPLINPLATDNPCNGVDENCDGNDDLPLVDPIPNQSVCSGAATTPITFTGTGTVYNWTNDKPSIGLPASGSGNIASFTALNPSASPVVATITVTPSSTSGSSGTFAYAANRSSNDVTVINLATNTVVATIPVGTEPGGAALSPDGTKLYVTNWLSNDVSVINTATNTVTATIPVGSNPYGVCFNPNGLHAYVVNYGSSNVSVINVASNSVTGNIPVGSTPLGVACNPSGTRLYVTNQGNNNVSVINTATNTLVTNVSVSSLPEGVAVSPDGTKVYVANQGASNVSVINAITNTLTTNITVGGGPLGLAITPDGTKLYVTNNYANTVSVVNTSTNAVVATVTVGNTPKGISITADGTKALVCNYSSNNVSVINIATNTVTNTIAAGGGTWSFGNFVKGGPSATCNGDTITFTITVGQAPVWYLDSDGDGYYTATQNSCNSPGAGWVSSAVSLGDCAPNDPTKWYTATLYIDADNDDYDNGTATVCVGASIPAGYKSTTLGSDCDDSDNTLWQTASLYVDADNDSYDGGTALVCFGATIPAGYVANTLGPDCDDNNPLVFLGGQTWYLDEDGDGYYTTTQSSCSYPGVGWVTAVFSAGDCSPSDPSIWQSATLYIDADNDNYDNGTAVVCYGASIPAGYKATTLGADCNDNNNLLTTVCSGTYTWVGNSVDWTDVNNWSPAGVPNNCNASVNIPANSTGGNYPEVNSATSIGNLQLGNGARITLNNSLSVCGNITGGNSGSNKPTVIGTNYLELSSTTPQTISGMVQFNNLRINNGNGVNLTTGAVADIITALQLQHGTFTTTGGTLRFKSGAQDEYAILDNFSDNTWDGVLSGNAVSERYVPVAGNNQHYLGTPIVGATFTQLGGSGTAGYLIPKPTCDQTQMANGSPYGNVFQWHDNDPDIIANNCLFYGWEVKKTGTTEAGRGYSVYLNQGTFSITGAINQGTTYTVGGCDNVGWTNNTLQTAGMVPAAYESGWHIVANPFQAPLQLSGHTPTFDDAAIWVTSGPYNGTYQPLSITGGTVAPFQGFIVHRSSASAANFVFSKSECVTAQGINYYKTASQHQLSINVSGNNFADVTYVEYNSDATNAFDVNYDSRKPLSKLGQPTLFTFNTNPNSRLSRNINRTISETPNVPMSFIPGADGTFSITVDGINTFDPTTYIFLEDKKTGTWTDMRANGSYSFQSVTADAHDRFVLHFTPAAIINTTAATCETNGTLYLEQPGTASWNYTITNSQSAIINAGTLNNSNSTVLGVPAGTYTITLTDNSGYTVVKAVTVSGNSATAAVLNSNSQSVEEGETITFSNASAGTTTAEWDMGDGTVFTNLNNINYQYTEPGVYTVTLTVTNADGCVSATTQLITVTEAAATGIVNVTNSGVNIFSFSSTVVVDFGKAKNVDATVDIYNLLGQKLTSDKTTNNIYAKNIADLGAAYVVVRVNNNGVESRKKVFLSGE